MIVTEEMLDNRDSRETCISLPNGMRIVVDPVMLFCNMLDNCWDPDRDRSQDDDNSLLDEMTDFIREHR